MLSNELSVRESSSSVRVESNAVSVDSEAFANLANRLESIATGLKAEEAEAEREFRPRVILAAKQFAHSRYELGRVLFEYRKKWKTDGAWLKVCKLVAQTLEISTRTVHRIVEGYVCASQLPGVVIDAFSAKGIDSAAKKNEALVLRAIEMIPSDEETSQELAEEIVNQVTAKFADPRDQYLRLTKKERQIFSLREQIRKGLDAIPPGERMDILRNALSELAFLVLGTITPFSLEITPRRGAFTVDGRKPIKTGTAA